jgi:hypothetical protein
MCSFCGSLGGDTHWSDSAPDSAERQRERLVRERLTTAILAHYGVRLKAADGDAYALTGKVPAAERAAHLVAMWPLVDRLSGALCDPLDPTLLALLDRMA